MDRHGRTGKKWSLGGLLPLVTLALYLGSTNSLAQELSPRAYWPAPIGTKAINVTYAYLSGDVLLNPDLPVEGTNVDANTLSLAYYESFDLFGRTASYSVDIPWVWGKVGTIIDLSQYVPPGTPLPPGFNPFYDFSEEFEGVGDISASLSVNLMGAPAMSMDEFIASMRDPDPVLGASIRIQAPTGTYNKYETVNFTKNRWAGKVELGYINPFSHGWVFEVETGVWFFGENNDHRFGTKEQDPVFAIESHLVRIIRPGFWASLDANYYRGGKTLTEGEGENNKQRSSKVGFTLVFPMDFKKAVKFSLYKGSVSESDYDFWGGMLSYTHRID